MASFNVRQCSPRRCEDKINKVDATNEPHPYDPADKQTLIKCRLIVSWQLVIKSTGNSTALYLINELDIKYYDNAPSKYTKTTQYREGWFQVYIGHLATPTPSGIYPYMDNLKCIVCA